MRDTVQKMRFLDGGSGVTVAVKDNRISAEFSHEHKKGIFKVEFDPCILDNSDTELNQMIKVVETVTAFVGKFDKLRIS